MSVDLKDLSDDELKARWFGALGDFPTTNSAELNVLHEELQRRRLLEELTGAFAGREAEAEEAIYPDGRPKDGDAEAPPKDKTAL
jgi:hypothetical protein